LILDPILSVYQGIYYRSIAFNQADPGLDKEY